MAPYAPATERTRDDLIQGSLGDQASLKFAADLVTAFRKAGWKIPPSVGQVISTGPIEGVIISIHSEDDSPPGLSEFMATLRQAGIEAKRQIAERIPAGEFHIRIGSKPSL
jgi:hypothetical protein